MVLSFLLILATYVGVNTIIYFAEVLVDTDTRVNIENAYKLVGCGITLSCA